MRSVVDAYNAVRNFTAIEWANDRGVVIHVLLTVLVVVIYAAIRRAAHDTYLIWAECRKLEFEACRDMQDITKEVRAIKIAKLTDAQAEQINKLAYRLTEYRNNKTALWRLTLIDILSIVIDGKTDHTE